METQPAVPIPTPTELARRVDWRDWYLTDEADMGESPEQTAIIMLMLGALRTWFEERRWRHAFVGGDHFFGWIEDEPLVRVSPDVYLLFDAPTPLPASWQTWRPDHPVPPFAMEVVSSDWRKDYEDAPSKYAQLGVSELVIFDPRAGDTDGGAGSGGRHRFQMWRRRAGRLVREHAGDGPVWSDVLELWLRAETGSPATRWLCRPTRDEAGVDPVLDGHERAAAEARAREAEARAREAEARAREAAEGRVAALEAELRRLRDG